MIRLKNFEVIGWEHAIRGMRNPLNSWEKSDSFYCKDDCYGGLCEFGGHSDRVCPVTDDNNYVIGNNDLTLMKQLAKAGTSHSKYRRMITVYVDITCKRI